MKRFRYPLMGLALLVLLGAVWNGLQIFSPSSPINSANFGGIKKGMTKKEVYAILGKPHIEFSLPSSFKYKPVQLSDLWFTSEVDPILWTTKWGFVERSNPILPSSFKDEVLEEISNSAVISRH